ncbi:unnamed protein product [Prunus armeniaca]
MQAAGLLSSCNILLQETISDGYDEGRSAQAESIDAYVERFWQVGSQTLSQLLEKLSSSAGSKVDCLVYDALMPGASDVAKKFGIFGAVFFTQSCAVNHIYYHVHKGLLKLPLSTAAAVDDDGQSNILLPGLPTLEPSDLPSSGNYSRSYRAICKMAVDQSSIVDNADWIFCNTFYDSEKQVFEVSVKNKGLLGSSYFVPDSSPKQLIWRA